MRLLELAHPLLPALAASAPAQVAQDQPPPVDRAVADLDPLATSFRRIEAGLGQFSPDAPLRQVQSAGWLHAGGVPLDPATGLPMPQGYVYSAPGFRAFLPRAEYVVRAVDDPNIKDRNVAPRVDGEFITVAGPNVVYDLVHRPERRIARPTDPNAVDHRLDTRIDGRLPARPAGMLTGNRNLSEPEPTLRSPTQLLLDHYHARPTPPPPPAAESAAQQPVVDEADAPQPRRDESDDAAGE